MSLMPPVLDLPVRDAAVAAPVPVPDAELAVRIAAGDLAALEQMYLSNSGSVYRYGLALCGNPGWAADAMQEAFLSFLNQPARYNAERGSLAAYLCGIARYSLWKLMRESEAAGTHARLDPDSPEGAGLEHSAGAWGNDVGNDFDSDADCGSDRAGADPLQALIARQDCEQLMAAVRALPMPFREALVLVDLQEHDYEQAARIMAVPLNTLRTRLYRARQRLAALLGATDGEAAALPAGHNAIHSKDHHAHD